MASRMLAKAPGPQYGGISQVHAGQHGSEGEVHPKNHESAGREDVHCGPDQYDTNSARPGPAVAFAHGKDQAGDGQTSDNDAHSSVGLSAISVSTISVASDRDQDGYPRLNVIVELPHGKEAFRARLDTGSDLNLITEEVARRLTMLESLEEDNLEEPITGLSTNPVRPVKIMKLVFFINGLQGPFKTWFHVVPDECVHEAFDALLGEKFIKATGIFTLNKELQGSCQK